nr:MAG TPA: hypothetical protein [Bacteriophage sp.]DAX36438.1 MAG TPA: hypothetical protein [Caudoviricetes sp.]DAX87128.1 MAG TPA: hypothetical protein [Caudoviricetes sp.]
MNFRRIGRGRSPIYFLDNNNYLLFSSSGDPNLIPIKSQANPFQIPV